MSIVTARSHTRRSKIANYCAALESLESRMLLSTVTGYAFPAISNSVGITHDNNGNLWISDTQGTIDKVTVDATGNPIDATAFDAGSAAGGFITFNPTNNNLYFNDNQGDIGVMDTNGNLLNSFPIPDAADHAPILMTTATDGSIWFAAINTTGTGGSVTRMDTAGNFTEFDIPLSNIAPVAVAAAPDGSVWVGIEGGITGTTLGDSSIGQATYNPSTGISFTDYAVPTPKGTLAGITVAPDNSVWYTEQNVIEPVTNQPANTFDRIGHAVLAAGTMTISEFVIPEAASEGPTTLPASPHLDSSGRLWFAEANHISYFDTTTNQFTRVATSDPGAASFDLTVTASGAYMTTLEGNYNLEAVTFADFAPPISSGAPDITATAGQPFSGAVAMFGSDQAGDFSYSLDYGDGNVDTGTIPFDGSGIYTVNGTQTYSTVGNFTTTLTISDAEGDISTFLGTASITPGVVGHAPLKGHGKNLKGPEAIALAPNISGISTLVVAKFTGSPAAYTATITWGDGTTSTGAIVQTGNKQYYVTLPSGVTKTYASQGLYTISVLITDGTNSITTTSTAKIADTPLVVSKALPLSPVGQSLPLTTVATFSDDLASTTSWFTATISWGDGTTSTGIIVRTAAGQYAVLGMHNYTKKGNYTIKTLVDNIVEDVTATATAKITIPKA